MRLCIEIVSNDGKTSIMDTVVQPEVQQLIHFINYTVVIPNCGDVSGQHADIAVCVPELPGTLSWQA